jgi:hypothetical protein
VPLREGFFSACSLLPLQLGGEQSASGHATAPFAGMKQAQERIDSIHLTSLQFHLRAKRRLRLDFICLKFAWRHRGCASWRVIYPIHHSSLAIGCSFPPVDDPFCSSDAADASWEVKRVQNPTGAASAGERRQGAEQCLID